jgi:hypothetical protein
MIMLFISSLAKAHQTLLEQQTTDKMNSMEEAVNYLGQLSN